tara:strand:+ start:1192 stop:1524 length:333 start_codon:yes stop_codon:yes gene_type:complete
MAPTEYIKEYDLYGSLPKCQYTGHTYIGSCSCYIHSRKSNNRNYFETSKNVNTLKRSSSHEILQIYPPVTEDQVRQAYKKMSLQTHPDKGGSNNDFIQVKQAYDDLRLCF